MARYDILTGLANRGVFAEALQHEIARAHRDGTSFAVLYLDLDHFKDVNDTLGHSIGDLLLKSVAERLRASVRETDTVSRFGGDEFALIATDLQEPADAATLALKILAATSEPVLIGNIEVRSGASVGIAVYGPDSADTDTLLSHADIALYRAKSEGRGTYRFFTEAMDAEVRTEFMLGAELRQALVSNQLYLMYQPQVDIYTGRIIGVEALVRWLHPTRGLISPGLFIPVAEKSGLIVAIGRWVMHQSCRQMKEWLDAGIAPPLIAVNLSALQFKTPRELENDLKAILAETGVPPQVIELELTEGVLMDASREHGDVLLRLRKAGFRIAIDDFGTGYSSLDYLRRFPVDRIKIAQQFMFDPTEGSGDAIIRAAIALAHELRLKVIVEGVETAKHLQRVKSCGGREVQGYYFSKPVQAEAMTALLMKGMSPSTRPALVLEGAAG
jgi:diguanylate cyclase (GGDEF)-like protein